MSSANLLKKERKKINVKLVKNIVITTLVLLVLFFYTTLLVFQFRHSNFEVEGSSMETTFYGGEKVFVKNTKSPKKDDIIVANYTKDGEDIFIIKRVIATAGDSIDIIREGNNISNFRYYVVLNGNKITEDYINTEWLYEQYKDELNGLNSYHDVLSIHYSRLYSYKIENGLNVAEPIIILPGYVFLMGDNRIVSEDSTKFGPKKTSEIVGVVNFVVDRGASKPEIFWKQICFAFTFK